MSSEREQRIAFLAHRIWEAEGKPSGQETRHWNMASKLVEAEERMETGADARAGVVPPASEDAGG